MTPMTVTADTDRLTGAGISQVAGIVRLLCDLRLASIAVSVLVAGSSDEPLWVLGALLLALPLSYIPLRHWDRIASRIMGSRTLLLLDAAYTSLLLIVVENPDVLLIYTVCTPLLGGLVFGPAGSIVSGGLMGGLFSGTALLTAWQGTATPASFASTIGLAVLYIVVGIGGARLRAMLDRQKRTEQELRAATLQAAHAAERTRLAREMHDSLSKTLHGLRLLALTVVRRLEGSGHELAVRDAGRLLASCDVAAREARRLMHDLRTEAPGEELTDSLARLAEEWAQRTGHALTLSFPSGDNGARPGSGRPPVRLGPGVTYELLCIVGEALENVDHHAGAGTVEVGLAVQDGWVEVTVRDDGAGFDVPDDPAALYREGHYGVIGMRERAQRAGGSLRLSSQVGRGTLVRVRVPDRLPVSSPDFEASNR
jgi:signal transduction histidine kinase